eukprot:CAMPEP_0169297550 /NCGR_PEP_ID=MMETSP1016-20121227/65812_1 /TAXON_ID=342587 /ORGANISM="Karlodinium micrum, Strain CCMP2283" /LENGTH=43 /DNA_ID= /DNA_START= /DNA_END= /DNA_ORIENTATION=
MLDRTLLDISPRNIDKYRQSDVVRLEGGSIGPLHMQRRVHHLG